MYDGFVKSHRMPIFVIPVKLVLDLIGERESREFNKFWTPAFAGVTVLLTFYEFIIYNKTLFVRHRRI